MSGLADARRAAGFANGFRARRDQNEAQEQHDEDRTRRMEREDSADAFTEESRAQQRTQWQDTNERSDAATAGQKLKNDQLKQRIEDEGALEFLYEIDSGADPRAAAQRHNMRGTSRMDENTVQYDPTAKTVSFDMDSDGDGKVETFQYKVPETISALERMTGRDKNRYMAVTDGSSVFDRGKGVIVANNPDDPTSRGGAAGTGTDKPIKVGPNDRLYDPKQRKFITSPMRGGAGGAGSPGVTKFNPQTYAEDVTNNLGKLVGGKYDPSTNQWDYGGATNKMMALNRIAQREAQRLIGAQGQITAPMIATAVAQMASDVSLVDPNTQEEYYRGDFDPQKIREAVQAQLDAHPSVENNEQGKFFGLGKVKPSVLKARQDQAIQDAIVDISMRTQTALDSEYQRLGNPNGVYEGDPGYQEPQAQEATPDSEPDADADDADPGQTPGDPYTVPQDFDPAVLPPPDQTGAVPSSGASAAPAQRRKPGDAGTLPEDAPPREKLRALKPGQGLRKGNVIWYVDDKGNVKKKTASGGR